MIAIGLAGRPVTHSLGQTVFNRYFLRKGIEAVYLSVDVTPENLGRFTEFAREKLAGFNVTIPHKVNVIHFLDTVEENAAKIGAVNLVKNREGKLYGYNTDYAAMSGAVARTGISLTGSSVALWGSGGVARTVLHYIRKNSRETSVSVFSRSPVEAEKKLSSYLDDKTVQIRDTAGIKGNEKFDILINCSPVGMWPEDKGMPFTPSLIRRCKAGIDLVYNPPLTVFLKTLRKEGKNSAGGTGFFTDQGYESMKILLEGGVDEDTFRNVAEEAIRESTEHG